MEPSECVCAVAIRREDGDSWELDPLREQTEGEGEGRSQIRWVFPVKGVPQSTMDEEEAPLIIECEVITSIFIVDIVIFIVFIVFFCVSIFVLAY